MARKFTAEHIDKLRKAHTGLKYPNRRRKSPEERSRFIPRNVDMPKATKQIDVDYCGDCSRSYLNKLGCLWCTKYDLHKKEIYQKI